MLPKPNTPTYTGRYATAQKETFLSPYPNCLEYLISITLKAGKKRGKTGNPGLDTGWAHKNPKAYDEK